MGGNDVKTCNYRRGGNFDFVARADLFGYHSVSYCDFTHFAGVVI